MTQAGLHGFTALTIGFSITQPSPGMAREPLKPEVVVARDFGKSKPVVPKERRVSGPTQQQVSETPSKKMQKKREGNYAPTKVKHPTPTHTHTRKALGART